MGVLEDADYSSLSQVGSKPLRLCCSPKCYWIFLIDLFIYLFCRTEAIKPTENQLKRKKFGACAPAPFLSSAGEVISYCLPQSGIHTGFQCVVPSSQPTMFYFVGARIEKKKKSRLAQFKQQLLHASIHYSKRTILKQDEDDAGVVQEKCSSGFVKLTSLPSGIPLYILLQVSVCCATSDSGARFTPARSRTAGCQRKT